MWLGAALQISCAVLHALETTFVLRLKYVIFLYNSVTVVDSWHYVYIENTFQKLTLFSL
jgi:hypothetical protein